MLVSVAAAEATNPKRKGLTQFNRGETLLFQGNTHVILLTSGQMEVVYGPVPRHHGLQVYYLKL